MLEYKQNINYMQALACNLDDELAELNHLCRMGVDDYQLYRKIRSYIFREIKLHELAATVILQDLTEIKNKNQKVAEVITFFIINNTCSYQDIAEAFGCSKQNIYQLLKRYAENYPWLKNLMEIKGLQDSRNENNRSIFFRRQGK